MRVVRATVLAWATMVAVTSAFDVAEPVRITLFAAGAAFEGALLAPDPHPKDRVRTLGWAAVVAGIAIVATVALTQSAVWAAAILLVLLMFSSYALRSWSPRIASLVLMGAITVYVTGAGYVTVGRIGWFVLAGLVGFGWLALWEALILPDKPLRSLNSSVQAFSCRAAGTVSTILDVLSTAREGTRPDGAGKPLRRNLNRTRNCRSAIEKQLASAVVRGFSQNSADNLRVEMHSAQRGLEDMASQADPPAWFQALPDQTASSIIDTMRALAVALRDDADAECQNTVTRAAQEMGRHIYDALTSTTETGEAPFAHEALLAALTLLASGEIVARSVTQARILVDTATKAARSEMSSIEGASGRADTSSPAGRRALSPTMALAIQAVVAAVVAGLFAKAVGNEQSLVVAWTAFVVIAGSAGLSTRRAWARLPATVLGAVVGVAIAACVPDNLFCTVAVVAVGVFFSVVSAPVSYPAMVFWMSIAFVPLFASEGRYLDLIRDKSVAALIGGCVAAVVSLTVVPIRISREIRPAVLRYLDALDEALKSHLPGRAESIATSQAELDRAHADLAAKAAAAATETNVFAQPERVMDSEAVLVDAAHEAYLRLTPLLSEATPIPARLDG